MSVAALIHAARARCGPLGGGAARRARRHDHERDGGRRDGEGGDGEPDADRRRGAVHAPVAPDVEADAEPAHGRARPCRGRPAHRHPGVVPPVPGRRRVTLGRVPRPPRRPVTPNSRRCHPMVGPHARTEQVRTHGETRLALRVRRARLRQRPRGRPTPACARGWRASTTGGATPAALASAHRLAHRHQRSPGRRPGEPELGARGGQVVARLRAEPQELGRDDGAHRVHAHVLRAGVAAPGAVEARHRIAAAGLQLVTQHVARHRTMLADDQPWRLRSRKNPSMTWRSPERATTS